MTEPVTAVGPAKVWVPSRRLRAAGDDMADILPPGMTIDCSSVCRRPAQRAGKGIQTSSAVLDARGPA
jgi:hypothetical protein